MHASGALKGKMKLVSKSTDADGADDTSADAVASASGRFVAFESDASDRVRNDKNGSTPDVFRRGPLR